MSNFNRINSGFVVRRPSIGSNSDSRILLVVSYSVIKRSPCTKSDSDSTLVDSH